MLSIQFIDINICLTLYCCEQCSCFKLLKHKILTLVKASQVID